MKEQVDQILSTIPLCNADRERVQKNLDELLASNRNAMEEYSPSKPRERRVVCAANRNKYTGAVVLGVRHHDAWMHSKNSVVEMAAQWQDAEQGFIDQRGVFMTRKEAWQVAFAAGQIRYRCGGDDKDGGTLFSENLY